MKKFFLTLALTGFCFSHYSFAENSQSTGGFVSGDFRLSNNYLWRGKTLSNNNFAVNHSLSYTFDPGAYIGYWTSNVELVDQNDVLDSGVEIDVFAGYRTEFGEDSEFGVDFGIQHYFYDIDSSVNNYNEIYVHVLLTDFTFSYFRSDEQLSSNYYEISWSQELGVDGLTTLSASVGYTQFSGREAPNEDFTAVNYLVGITLYFGASGNITFAYSGVTQDAAEYGLASVANSRSAANNRFLISWGITF